MTAPMTIRPARSCDAGAICALWNHYIRNTTVTFSPTEKSEAEIGNLIVAGGVLVAVEGETVIGFARFFQFRGGAGYAHTAEHTILFAPGRGGFGRGRALLNAVTEAARAAGMHTIYAGVSGENPGAVAFHTACGFETLARLPDAGHKFGRWIDLVLMLKRL